MIVSLKFLGGLSSKLFQEEGKMAEGYCVKCKAKKQMVNSSEITMANGRQAMKGKCPDCGTGMFKILGKKK
jgi:NAD-dependent SIR2 family protein deacetylase